jgi:hypothetical protein
MDGRVVGVEENFWDEGDVMQVDVGESTYAVEFNYGDVGVPPLHPNCLLPGTRIESSGDIIAGYRARYSGPAVEIELSDGNKTTVTGNHLILTTRGFAPAQLLREGEDIICRSGTNRTGNINPDNNQIPTFAKDIFDTFWKSASRRSCSVPISEIYFHGDGRFCDGDIDIIRTDGFLGNAFESTLNEKLEHFNLAVSDLGPDFFFGKSHFTSPLEIVAGLSDCFMGGLRQPNPFFFRRPGHSQEHGITSIPGDNFGFEQTPPDNASANFELFSKALLGITGEIKAADFGIIQFEPPIWFGKSSVSNRDSGTPEIMTNRVSRCLKFIGELIHIHPGIIKTTKVKSIKVFSYVGHVYDFQTSTSIYTSNTMAMSNCRCAIGAYFK